MRFQRTSSFANVGHKILLAMYLQCVSYCIGAEREPCDMGDRIYCRITSGFETKAKSRTSTLRLVQGPYTPYASEVQPLPLPTTRPTEPLNQFFFKSILNSVTDSNTGTVTRRVKADDERLVRFAIAYCTSPSSQVPVAKFHNVYIRQPVITNEDSFLIRRQSRTRPT